jgi:hypothetical protein
MMPPSAQAEHPHPAPLLSAAGGAEVDLFACGRQAAAAARAAHEGQAVFARSKQLLGTGAWKGPRDAAESFVEEEDLAALGGLGAALEAGVRTLLATSAASARDGAAAGLRVLWRLPYRAGEPEESRRQKLEAVAGLLRSGVAIDAVVPTPEGEPMGLDSLALVARVRLQLPVKHVVADFVRLGHRLAQMSLGFGADELWGPIMPERALRLGANANNPVMTRKEAATLIRGAGLKPAERLAGGTLEEVEA